MDLTKIDTLVERMEKDISAIAELTEQLSETITQARQPVISERKITLDIVAKETVFLFIGMLIVISWLSAWLYLATRPNYDRIDNDLKYRYIKMKGEATLDEQARLRQLEAEKLNHEVEKLKKR